MKRLLSSILLMSMLAFGFVALTPAIDVQAGIKDTIQSENIEKLENTADESGSKFISFVRGIAITVAVIMLLWMGFLKFFSGDAQSISQMKMKLGVFVLAMLFTFKTEALLGALFSLFGVDLNSI